MGDREGGFGADSGGYGGPVRGFGGSAFGRAALVPGHLDGSRDGLTPVNYGSGGRSDGARGKCHKLRAS